VCWEGPLFVQQTVAPLGTETSAGVNEKSAIMIIVSLGLQTAPLDRGGEA